MFKILVRETFGLLLYTSLNQASHLYTILQIIKLSNLTGVQSLE